MKIEQIDLFHVAMPLISPWRTAYGEDAAIHAVLCRIQSGSVEAWGESSPLAAPCYSPEWGGGIFAVCRDWLAPALVQQDVASGEDLQQRLAHFKGNPFAKAVLDTAWWNLSSRLQNKRLHESLGEFAGVQPRDEVPVGADFGVLDSVADLVDCVNGAVEQKFPRIKLKFRPGWDVAMLREVRRAQPTQPVHIDCNSGYRLADVELFRRIDEFQLAMIEQPLQHDDLIDHAELQRSIRTPVCLDESLVTLRQAQQAIAVGSCRYANVKPGRVGGLTNAVKIHNEFARAGIPCWVGGMLESATGACMCAALAMLPNFTYPADIFPSSRFYHQDLAESPLELIRTADGIPGVQAPDSIPDPNPDRLKRLTVQQATIR